MYILMKLIQSLFSVHSLIRTLNQSVGCIAMIEGRSMQPTFNPSVHKKHCRDWVLVSKLGLSKYQLNRGDVVMLKYFYYYFEKLTSLTLRSPQDPTRYLVKRIVGLPGDWIQLKGNKLVVFYLPVKLWYLSL